MVEINSTQCQAEAEKSPGSQMFERTLTDTCLGRTLTVGGGHAVLKESSDAMLNVAWSLEP